MGTTTKDISKKIPVIQRVDPDAERPKSYVIHFKNASNEVWPLWFANRPTERIRPHTEFVTEVTDPKNIYARWATVTYLGNYQFEFEVREGWIEPERDFPVTIFLNEAGAQTEVLNFPIGSVRMPRGIPIHSTCWLFSHVAEYGRYTIKRISKKVPATTHMETSEEYIDENVKLPNFEGYLDHTTIHRKVRKKQIVEDPETEIETVDVVLEEKRSYEELQKLYAMREEIRSKETQARGEQG